MEYELQFTLTAPCPWFLSRLTYNWGYPTCAKFLDEMGESFGTNNDTILYCGAFLCSQYEPNSYVISTRNFKINFSDGSLAKNMPKHLAG